jgi:hypothetical protein
MMISGVGSSDTLGGSPAECALILRMQEPAGSGGYCVHQAGQSGHGTEYASLETAVAAAGELLGPVRVNEVAAGHWETI